MDKISIILPVYNCENFVAECIDSIKRQTLDNFEVVIIDDCSTDNTGAILQNAIIGDHRFTYYHNEKNLQISACRNKGIKLSTGNYIFFVDADDILNSRCLERLYHSLIETESDVAICGFEMFENQPALNGKSSRQITLTNNELMREIALCDRIQNFAWGKLYKKALFSDIAFPEGRIYEDVYVIPLVLSKASKASFIEEKLYCYRQNYNSLSKTLDLNKIQDFFASMQQKAELIISNYSSSASLMSQSFFDLFYLLKEHRIKKSSIKNYKITKALYRKIVANAPFKQKIKYILAVI